MTRKSNSRMIEKRPEPLPESFVKRLAATAASEPVALGRIIRHALVESRARGGVYAG